MRSEEFYVNENPLTLAGIEPATFRFVAQRLNHRATVCIRNVPFTILHIRQYRISCQQSHNRSQLSFVFRLEAFSSVF
jgi:hypothetical protein